MKRLLAIGCILLWAGCAMAERTGIHASDARLVYVGRTKVDSSTVSMDWTGTYVRIHYYGNRLSVRVSDTGTNYYNLYIDRPFAAEPDTVLTVSGDTTIVLYAEAKARRLRSEKAKKRCEHTLLLYKRTEGEQGRTTFHEFFVDDGELLQAQPVKQRYIEFVGDSYTCGYGVENSGPKDRFSPTTESSAKSYAAIVARYFEADFCLIAHSGFGVVRNYNSKFAGWCMPEHYLQTFDMDSTTLYPLPTTHYPLSPLTPHPSPAITIILLGGNDFSVGQHPTYEHFKAGYMRLLQQIKSNYGATHPVLCCVKKAQPLLLDYVRRVVKDCGMTNVSFCPFYPSVFYDDERNLGADYHPNYEGHKKAAHVVLPYVSTMTDWPLTGNPIE